MAQIILDSNNNLIQGDFDNATINNRTKFKTTTTNATTNVYAVPNGSATSAGFTVTNAADPTNASKLTIATNGSTDTQIISGVNGSGTYLPLSFYTNNALAAQIDTSGNFFATGKMGGAGSVIQVVSATKSDTSSTSSSTFSDVSGLSVSITPSSASNKILIIGNINISWQDAVCKAGARLVRNSTAIAIGDVDGSRQQVTGYLYAGVTNYAPFAVPVTYLDSPATTSAITYKWQFNSLDNTGTVYCNRGYSWGNDSTVGTSVSSITVMEIKV